MRPDSLPKIPARVPTAERNSQVRTGRVNSREGDSSLFLSLSVSLSAALAAAEMNRRLAKMRIHFMGESATVARLSLLRIGRVAIAGRGGACRRLQTAIRLSIKESGRF